MASDVMLRRTPPEIISIKMGMKLESGTIHSQTASINASKPKIT